MLLENQCNYCPAKLPVNQLYMIKEGNWTALKACENCLNKIKKEDIPNPLKTVEQYILGKQKQSVVRVLSQQSTTRSTKGVANIDNQDCSVVLEEITTTTRRVILNPKSSD